MFIGCVYFAEEIIVKNTKGLGNQTLWFKIMLLFENPEKIFEL